MTSTDPYTSGQKPIRRATPRKLGQPSKLTPKIRAILARTNAATGGVAAPREASEPPRPCPSHPPDSVVCLTDEARRVLGGRKRVLTVVACECPLCRDGRWVAVDAPWKYDPAQKQHYACSKLRRPGRQKPATQEDQEE